MTLNTLKNQHVLYSRIIILVYVKKNNTRNPKNIAIHDVLNLVQ